MKKLLFAMVTLLSVSNAFGGFFGCGRSSGCSRAKACETSVSCEDKPVCYKMVRKECPPRKVCETNCHYVCPQDTIREDGRGEE